MLARLPAAVRGGSRPDPGDGGNRAYHECGPQLLSFENRRKIKPKEIRTCLIPQLLDVFPRQLEMLATTLVLSWLNVEKMDALPPGESLSIIMRCPYKQVSIVHKGWFDFIMNVRRFLKGCCKRQFTSDLIF